MDSAIPGLEFVDVAPRPVPGQSRKKQARALCPFILRQYFAGRDVTARDCAEHLAAEGVIATSSAKGVGDALGAADGGLGLHRTSAGVYTRSRENATRCAQRVGVDGLAALAQECGLASDEELITAINKLPKITVA